MNRRTWRSTVVALVFGIVSIAAGSPAHGAEWEWALTPFVWGSDVAMDTTFASGKIVSAEVDFGDLVDKLDFAGQVHFEGRRGEWGFFVELNYIELSDDQTVSDRGNLVNGTEVDTSLDQLIAEAGGMFHVAGEDTGLDVLVGVRVLDLSFDLDLDFKAASIDDRTITMDKNFIDGFAGLRYRGQFGQRWSWWARGDVGTGDTDLSWQGIVGVGVNLGAKGNKALLFGYRHLEFEIEPDNRVIDEVEMELSGPFVGFRFGF